MDPESYIARLERIVAAKQYANARAFAAKHYSPLAERLTETQRETIHVLMATMDAAPERAPTLVRGGALPLRSRRDALDITIFGDPEAKTVEQMRRCLTMPEAAAGVLCADAHYGYSQPVGGVAAYRDAVSVSGVGYDIGCGLKGVRTNLKASDVRADLPKVVDLIARAVSFGIGRKNPRPVEHPLFDDPLWTDLPWYGRMREMARAQLGTVGSGNHFIDLLVEPATDDLWVSTHFGSRGLGHKTATGFLNLAHGLGFDDRPRSESMDAAPTLLATESALGQAYLAAMRLAGAYAYAGRDAVIGEVLGILGASATFAVHNHHNFAWEEEHFGERLYVVRKGATPLAPGQLGFVGGSMADISVVVEGSASETGARALYSAMHGAGRIMSRTRAAGKVKYMRDATGRKQMQRLGGDVTPEMMREAVRAYGVEVRGAGTDESPFVYRKLADVLAAHAGTLVVRHLLQPIGVVMAGEGEVDPYKD
jgi:tRNA-splicing ligase RtcB (3'-phosphate/5'-hydroxy nucleic acid ligase)